MRPLSKKDFDELKSIARELVEIINLRVDSRPPIRDALTLLNFTEAHLNIIRENSTSALKDFLNPVAPEGGEAEPPKTADDLPEILAHSFWDGIVKIDTKLGNLEYSGSLSQRNTNAIKASLDLIGIIDLLRGNFGMILGLPPPSSVSSDNIQSNDPDLADLFDAATSFDDTLLDVPAVFLVLNLVHESLIDILHRTQKWTPDMIEKKIEERVAAGEWDGFDIVYDLDPQKWEAAYGTIPKIKPFSLGSPP